MLTDFHIFQQQTLQKTREGTNADRGQSNAWGTRYTANWTLRVSVYHFADARVRWNSPSLCPHLSAFWLTSAAFVWTYLWPHRFSRHTSYRSKQDFQRRVNFRFWSHCMSELIICAIRLCEANGRHKTKRFTWTMLDQLDSILRNVSPQSLL